MKCFAKCNEATTTIFNPKIRTMSIVVNWLGCYSHTIANPYIMIEINKLKKGDFFKLNEKSGIVFVYDGYNRSLKKYEAFKFEDISSFKTFKKGKLVYINFEF